MSTNPTMIAALTMQQLYELAVTCGANQKIGITLADIAWRESRGVPTVHNTVAPDDSYGLWQINMLSVTIKEFVEQLYPEVARDPTRLFDPVINCKCAIALYRGQRSFLNTLWRIDSPGPPRDAFLKFLPDAHFAALASKL